MAKVEVYVRNGEGWEIVEFVGPTVGTLGEWGGA